MTVKSGPTYRARTEESPNNRPHSNTTHMPCRAHVFRTRHQTSSPSPLRQHPCCAGSLLRQPSPRRWQAHPNCEELREKVDLYMSGRRIGSILRRESRVVQTKGGKHLGITTAAVFSLHSCFHRCVELFPGCGDSP